MNEPKRWLDDDSDLSDDERRALRAGFSAPVPRGAQSVVWGALRNKLPLGIAGAALGATATKAAAAVSIVKMGLTGVALGSVVAVAIVGGEHLLAPTPAATRPSSTPLRPAEVAPAPPTPQPRPVEPTPALDPTPELPHPPTPHERPKPTPVGVEQPVPTLAPPERSVASFAVPAPPVPHEVDAGTASLESRRVADARARLRAGNASGALGVLDSIRRDFPNGVLVQERDALTIEALLALGEYSRARSLATAFLARYPGSPHAEAARRALK
jgi:hypothetical protein